MSRTFAFALTVLVALSSFSVHADPHRKGQTLNSDRSHVINGHQPAFTGPNLRPFLPKDLVLVDNRSVGKTCDQNGNYDTAAKFRCTETMSAGAGSRYRIRLSDPEGDRAFAVSNGQPTLYVQLNRNVVIYKTSVAVQMAASNGYRLDDNGTAVAVNAAPAPAQEIDCSKPRRSPGALNYCAKQGGTGYVAQRGGQPPGGQAPAQDCTKGSFIQQQACKHGLGEAAAGLSKLTDK